MRTVATTEVSFALVVDEHKLWVLQQCIKHPQQLIVVEAGAL